MRISTLILGSLLLALTLTESEAMAMDGIQIRTINENNESLMDILQKIINDQEFLTLEKKHQLRILFIIYDMLDGYYRKQFLNKNPK